MSQLRKFEIKPENGAIAIRIVNPTTPNAWEYYRFSAIKSIVPVSVLGMGIRQPDNNRKNPIRFDNKLEFVISFHDENESSPLRYNIEDVDNQPTWTNDLAGLIVALADMNSWMNSSSSGPGPGGSFLTPPESTALLSLTSIPVTHNSIVATNAGTVSGAIRGSVLNQGNADGVWNGINIPPGVSIPFEEVGNRDIYADIPYDGTGTTLIIEYTT